MAGVCCLLCALSVVCWCLLFGAVCWSFLLVGCSLSFADCWLLFLACYLLCIVCWCFCCLRCLLLFVFCFVGLLCFGVSGATCSCWPRQFPPQLALCGGYNTLLSRGPEKSNSTTMVARNSDNDDGSTLRSGACSRVRRTLVTLPATDTTHKPPVEPSVLIKL